MSSKNYITNIYQGANFKKVDISKDISELCKKISRTFKLGYGGIDLKIFKKSPYVLEINSIPSWKAIQQTDKKNIAKNTTWKGNWKSVKKMGLRYYFRMQLNVLMEKMLR